MYPFRGNVFKHPARNSIKNPKENHSLKVQTTTRARKFVNVMLETIKEAAASVVIAW